MLLLRLIGAFVLLLSGFGVALAEEFQAHIVKVEADKIIVVRVRDGTKKGEKRTVNRLALPLAKKVEVGQIKHIKDGKGLKFGPVQKIKDGLKNEHFKDIKPLGIYASIATDDEGKVTSIVVIGDFRKKRKKEKKKAD